MAEPNKKPENPVGRLTTLGINELFETLFCLPKDYDDFRELIGKDDIEVNVGCRVNLAVKALSAPRQVAHKPQPRYSISVTNGKHRLTLSDFGYLKQTAWAEVKEGDILFVQADIQVFSDRFYLSKPMMIPAISRGRLAPRYAGKPGVLKGETVREKVTEALQDENSYALAAESIKRQLGGMDEQAVISGSGIQYENLTAMLKAIHQPESLEAAIDGLQAVKKVAIYSLLYQAQQANVRPISLPSAIRITGPMVAELIQRLPFPLTRGQTRVLHEIIRDLNAPSPMNRLLSGDVGAGKTAPYIVSAVAAQKAGAKVAILIPNGLLCEQVVAEAKSWFPEANIQIIMGGSNPTSINFDDNPILVGTTALLNLLSKRTWRPDYLLVDEQQKTSREQREAILARHTNMLEATATCVPRTAAMVTHGGMAVSILNEFPVSKKIHTKIVANDGNKAEFDTARKEMFNHLTALVKEGHQIALVYPLVNSEDEADNKKSVEAAGGMWEKVFPGRVGVLHGKLDADSKAATMAKMKAREYDVLVASTVVEIGITIPALKAIVIVHAERYGVSTLHQIRGRVARHGGEGFCYLYLPQEVSEDSMQRMRLMEEISDGFKLAEADMEMRGFGDLSDDSSEQYGATRTMFIGLDLTPQDLAQYGV